MNVVFSRRGFVLAGAALGLCGCATTPVLAPARPGDVLPELEPLLAVRTEADGLTIRVASRGCTKREDFVFRVEPRGQGVAVAFARRRLDVCRAPDAAPVELRFGYDALGLRPGQDVLILNPH